LRRGATSLGTEAAKSVRNFVLSQLNEDGGFRGRSRESDIYYTVFGLQCAQALDLDLPAKPIGNFLQRCAGADELDFVHLCCLARSIEILGQGGIPELARWAVQGKRRLAACVCREGGYHRLPDRPWGSVYESFLGMLTCEAFSEPFPDPHKMGQCLARRQRSSGGFVNDDGFGTPTTPVTAAALEICRELELPTPLRTREWLTARLSPKGGFCAAALVPMPDLLSTATALYAARNQGWIEQVPIKTSVEFVTSVWDESGGFGGHRFDQRADCEYTFYGLLALGSLINEEAI